jgi:hypothetical protein
MSNEIVVSIPGVALFTANTTATKAICTMYRFYWGDASSPDLRINMVVEYRDAMDRLTASETWDIADASIPTSRAAVGITFIDVLEEHVRFIMDGVINDTYTFPLIRTIGARLI